MKHPVHMVLLWAWLLHAVDLLAPALWTAVIDLKVCLHVRRAVATCLHIL